MPCGIKCQRAKNRSGMSTALNHRDETGMLSRAGSGSAALNRRPTSVRKFKEPGAIVPRVSSATVQKDKPEEDRNT